MKISENLEMLELSLSSLGLNGSIHPVILWDEKSAILVDVGLQGLLPVLKDEIRKLNLPFSNIEKVIITHGDLDHIGNLALLQNEFGDKLNTISHTREKPFVEFEEKSSKITDEKFAEIEPTMRSKVDCLVNHEDEIDECGGIIVIHTPGHTPGHICLYLKKHKVLIAGDALNVIDGKLMGPNPRFTPDMSQAKESLKKLLDYDIESVICYHGGLYTGNFKEAIDQFMANIN